MSILLMVIDKFLSMECFPYESLQTFFYPSLYYNMKSNDSDPKQSTDNNHQRDLDKTRRSREKDLVMGTQ